MCQDLGPTCIFSPIYRHLEALEPLILLASLLAASTKPCIQSNRRNWPKAQRPRIREIWRVSQDPRLSQNSGMTVRLIKWMLTS